MKELLLLVMALLVTCTHAAVVQSELDALTSLYNSTGGNEWVSNANWLQGDPCENAWEGIGCNPSLTAVVSIDLGYNNLQGTLPDEFDKYQELEEVSLQGNQKLTGHLPRTLLNTKGIYEVYLTGCDFIGSIPPVSSNCTLGYLYLDRNNLNSTIPSYLFQVHTMVELSLSSNSLSGTISDVAEANSFNSIDLSGNQLTGTLPPSLVSNTVLENLYIDSNLLQGTIPDSFPSAIPGNITSRRHFNFNSNNFSGTVPPSLLAVPSVVILDISNNEFTGTLPDTFVGSSIYSTYVYVDHNNLQGVLPASLLSLPNLIEFDGSYNSFTEFGTWVGDSHRTQVDLSSTAISSFPTTEQFAGLDYFILNDNSLTGSIPADVDFTGVRTVEVKNSKLSGSIPEGVYDLFEFRGDSNAFTGTIPENLDDLKIQTFEVPYNQLTGKIETECPLTENLQLQGNCFDCPLPSCCSQKWCENASSCDCNVWNSYGSWIVAGVLAVCCCCAVLPTVLAGVFVAVRRRRSRKQYEEIDADRDLNS